MYIWLKQLQQNCSSRWSEERDVCFSTIKKKTADRDIIISYDVKELESISDSGVEKWKKSDITKDILLQIKKMWYELNKKFLITT